MKLVRENINFERGQKPSQAMDIGLGKHAEKIILTDKLVSQYGFWMTDEITYDGLLIGVAKEWRDQAGNYVILSGDDDFGETDYAWLIDPAGSQDFPHVYSLINRNIMNSYFSLKESVNFERGQDPRKSMNIGLGEYRNEILKIDNIVSKYGFEMKSDFSTLSDPGEFNDIKEWRDEEGNLLLLYKNVHEGKFMFVLTEGPDFVNSGGIFDLDELTERKFIHLFEYPRKPVA